MMAPDGTKPGSVMMVDTIDSPNTALSSLAWRLGPASDRGEGGGRQAGEAPPAGGVGARAMDASMHARGNF